ncbi:MAG TPA: DUF1145 domain-containing protein [Pseudomonadales bacterium]
MQQFILIGKVSTLILWAVLIVNLFYPLAGGYSQYLTWGLIALAVTHLLEAVVFMLKNKDSEESVLGDTFKVFVYGFFHPLSLKQNSEPS